MVDPNIQIFRDLSHQYVGSVEWVLSSEKKWLRVQAMHDKQIS